MSNGLPMEEEALTVDDLAKWQKISKIWIYKLCKERRIPHYRIESCIRFDRRSILEWSEKKKV